MMPHNPPRTSRRDRPGEDVAGHHAARQRHQEVEGDRRKRCWREINIRRRPGIAGDLACDRRRIDDGNLAGRVETPEARIDHQENGTDQPGIMRRNIARRSISAEFPQAGPQHDEHRQCRATGDRMNDARCIGVMIAQQPHHPAQRMPSPSRIEDPHRRTDQNRDNPECARADPLDDHARDDRGGGDREEQEGSPEHTVQPVPVGRSVAASTPAGGGGVGTRKDVSPSAGSTVRPIPLL